METGVKPIRIKIYQLGRDSAPDMMNNIIEWSWMFADVMDVTEYMWETLDEAFR